MTSLKFTPVFQLYYPSSDKECQKIYASLIEYGWNESQIQELENVRNKVVITNATGKGFVVNSKWLNAALHHNIIKFYYIDTWNYCFEGQMPNQTKPFKPYPECDTLMSSDGVPHYLWHSSDLKSIILQLWFYCNQNEEIFQKAITATWQIYRGYSKFDCGYAGEVDKFACTLKQMCDKFK